MTQTIAQLLPEAARQLPDGWTLTETPGGVQLAFPGGRKQSIQIEERRGRYVFSSVVLGAARTAEQQGRDGTALTARLWEINREIGLVGFMLDTHGRLVGRIDHPAETLDAAELAINLELLARECDRLEYIWSGHDMS